MILHPGCTHEALRLQRAERLAREADLLGHARTEITNEACSCSSIPLLHSIRTILQGSVKDDRTYLAVVSRAKYTLQNCYSQLHVHLSSAT